MNLTSDKASASKKKSVLTRKRTDDEFERAPTKNELLATRIAKSTDKEEEYDFSDFVPPADDNVKIEDKDPFEEAMEDSAAAKAASVDSQTESEPSTSDTEELEETEESEEPEEEKPDVGDCSLVPTPMARYDTPFRVMILGASETGKGTVIKNMLSTVFAGVWAKEDVFIFGGTVINDREYWQRNGYTNLKAKANGEEIVNTVYRRWVDYETRVAALFEKKKLPPPKPRNRLIIMDDIVGMNFKGDAFKNMMTECRHKGFSIIISLQEYLNTCGKGARKQFSHIICCRPDNEDISELAKKCAQNTPAQFRTACGFIERGRPLQIRVGFDATVPELQILDIPKYEAPITHPR